MRPSGELAGIPVSVRRLALAGHQTAVLEGGDGSPANRWMPQGWSPGWAS